MQPHHLSALPYMRWAKHESGKGDVLLTMSAVPPLDWEELGLDPATLELCVYSPYGDDELLTTIAAPWGRSADDVLLASSTTHAHFCFAASSVAPGDRVLYECPGYLPLVDSISLLDVEAVRYHRRFEDRYALPQDEIRRLVESTHASLLLVTNLHNPSGVALTEDDKTFLVDLCERTDIEVLCDEAYRPALDPDPGPLALRHPNIISVWGLNKVHGMPLIRVGWGLSHPQRVDMARRILDSTTVHNSCLSDQVARHAVKHLARLEERCRRIAADGWAVARPVLERSPLEVVWPDAGIIRFPRIPTEIFPDGEALREALLAEGVGITPGSYFEAEHHFRMSVGVPPAELTGALGHLERLLARSDD